MWHWNTAGYVLPMTAEYQSGMTQYCETGKERRREQNKKAAANVGNQTQTEKEKGELPNDRNKLQKDLVKVRNHQRGHQGNSMEKTSLLNNQGGTSG